MGRSKEKLDNKANPHRNPTAKGSGKGDGYFGIGAIGKGCQRRTLGKQKFIEFSFISEPFRLKDLKIGKALVIHFFLRFPIFALVMHDHSSLWVGCSDCRQPCSRINSMTNLDTIGDRIENEVNVTFFHGQREKNIGIS